MCKLFYQSCMNNKQFPTAKQLLFIIDKSLGKFGSLLLSFTTGIKMKTIGEYAHAYSQLPASLCL